jgi:L-methionine (R)-S-oxide reductase
MNNRLIDSLKELIKGERNFIANAANFSSFLYFELEDLNWVGFYMLEHDELVLGPFCGKTACIRIKIGKGVTGTSAKTRSTILVDDVHEFPGHIACDANSRSELVIPMIYDDELIGVLDIDSPILKRFTDQDKELIENLLEILIQNSDIGSIKKYYAQKSI